MTRSVSLLLLGVVGLTLPGCVARAVYDVATLPVKAASKTVDVLTTSQSEADEKRGREMREADERRGREAREQCRQAKRDAKRNGWPEPAC